MQLKCMWWLRHYTMLSVSRTKISNIIKKKLQVLYWRYWKTERTFLFHMSFIFFKVKSFLLFKNLYCEENYFLYEIRFVGRCRIQKSGKYFVWRLTVFYRRKKILHFTRIIDRHKSWIPSENCIKILKRKCKGRRFDFFHLG